MRRPPSIRSVIDRFRGEGIAAESAWSLALELLTMAGTILAFTFLGRTLGAEGYGGYASLYAIIGPIVTLSASGVTLSLLQHVVRDGEPIDQTARSCLSLSIVLGLLLTAGAAVFAFWIVDSLSAVAIVSILLIELVTSPLVNVAAATVQAGSSFIGATRIRMLLVGGRTLLLIGLYVSGSLTVASLGVSQLIWSAVLTVIVLRVTGRRFGFRFWPGRVRFSHLRSNVLYSTAISADAIGNDGDKVVLAANRFVVETGLYAAAYRIVMLGMVPIGSLVSVSHKRFLEREEGRRGEHLQLAIRYSTLSGAFGLVFGIAVFIAAPLFPIIVGESFEGSVEMVRWLSPIVFLRAIGIYSLNGLMGLDRVRLRTILISANAAFGMVLYLTLIPRYGWEGALVGTLVTEALQVVMTWIALVVVQRKADRAMDAADAAVAAAASDDDDIWLPVPDLDAEGAEDPADPAEDLGEVPPPPG